MSKFVWLLPWWAIFASSSVFAQAERSAPSVSGCRYAVAYMAPPACPGPDALQRRLGDAFRVVAGTMTSCEDCVRGIVIRQPVDAGDDGQRSYEMSMAGLEATTVRRDSCDELLDLGVYAVEASDLPEPVCEHLPLQVGVSGASMVDAARGELLWLVQLRTSLQLGDWQVTPFGSWIAPTTVSNQMPSALREGLDLQGYGAGLDVCWRLWGTTRAAADERALQVCGVGSWRRLEVTPSHGDFVSVHSADMWSAGLAFAAYWQPTSSLRLEAAPAVSTSVVPAITSYGAAGGRLYARSGIEGTLRVGFSWGLPPSGTPSNTQALHSARTAPRHAPNALRSTHSLGAVARDEPSADTGSL